MVPTKWQTHAEFLGQLNSLTRRPVLRRGGPKAFRAYRQVEAIVRELDLDFLIAILRTLYAVIGRPARDPIPLFRALIVMVHLKVSSLTEWAERLRREPILAGLCGLEPEHLPGVANFYDLIHRISESQPGKSVVRRSLQRPKGAKKGKKAPPRRPGSVERILRRLRSHPPRPPFPLWQRIFRQVVEQSRKRGLLGSELRLAAAVDGSPLPSGGDGHGHRVCGCRREDPCEHKMRRYSDPGARVGWDSYRNRYFYGRHLSAIVATSGGHDLPLYLRLFQGNRHDAVAGVVAFAEAEVLYPGAFGRLVADSAFDAMPIYLYLEERDMEAVIDLNGDDVDGPPPSKARRLPPANRRPRERRGRGKRPLAEKEGIALNTEGRAICRSRHAMIKRGSSHNGLYTQWCCPLSKKGDLSCPTPCFYRDHTASLRRNWRLQPRIPRGSPQWEEAMDARTAAERTFAHLKGPLGLLNGRHRSDSVWAAHTILAGITMHLQAWAGVLDPAFDTISAA